MTTPQTVLDFWFSEEHSKEWFRKSEAFDQLIRYNFLEAYEQAIAGTYDDWSNKPDSCLALVILTDQFPRNMFRGSGRMYEGDPKSLALTKLAIERDYPNELGDAQRKFLLMPLMHSESLEDQELGVEMFAKHCDERTAEYAVKHRDVVAEFGRFPHRNDLLDRECTEAELEYLAKPGSGF
ncbi:MAG: DUF924 domain-containing protein [Deltaproteobacteria bacterium]|nr:MAG: DUF924 domain-containing protein [Deltaproteobacteria bacterium]